jgi:CMP-N,N'-diacetyllegionaminic acid synthase
VLQRYVLTRIVRRGLPRKISLYLSGMLRFLGTIEVVKESSVLDSIVVITEDAEIGAQTRELGAKVAFCRLHGFSNESTPCIEFAIRANSLLPRVDRVLLLKPTSPLRTSPDLDAMSELAELCGTRFDVSILDWWNHPQWCESKDGSIRLLGWVSNPVVSRKRDPQTAHVLNGPPYLAEFDWLLKTRVFVTEERLGYVMPVEGSVDIHTPIDWKYAKFLRQESDRE